MKEHKKLYTMKLLTGQNIKVTYQNVEKLRNNLRFFW